VTVTEYAIEDGIEKNYSNKNYRDHEGLSFDDLDFELNLKVDLIQIQPAKARSVADRSAS